MRKNLDTIEVQYKLQNVTMKEGPLPVHFMSTSTDFLLEVWSVATATLEGVRLCILCDQDVEIDCEIYEDIKYY